MKITEELIISRTDKYINEHMDEVLEEIDKRIAKAVRSSIIDYFRSTSWKSSEIEDYITGRVSEIAKSEIDKLEIDSEEIARLAQKKIEQKIRKINVNFGE